MAYPYYFNPNTYYQPLVYPPQQLQQQMPPQIPQPPQQQQTPGIQWVDDEREAAMYPIAPNNAVALWEKSGKRAYMKKADATGKPTMTVYDLVERAEKASGASECSEGNLPTYATKDELGAVVGAIQGYDDAIKSIKSEIDTMKGDLYGVAGKRRMKKQEAEDE